MQTTTLSRRYAVWPELDRLYDVPLNHWVLVRISSRSEKAELLAEMIFIRDEFISLLNELGEVWTIEIQAIERKIYMRKIKTPHGP